jgi:hypothetical protein
MKDIGPYRDREPPQPTKEERRMEALRDAAKELLLDDASFVIWLSAILTGKNRVMDPMELAALLRASIVIQCEADILRLEKHPVFKAIERTLENG